MASKDQLKHFKGKQDLASNNSIDIYNNFTLNKNHKCTTKFNYGSSNNVKIGKLKSSNYERTAALTKVSDVTVKTTSQKDRISLKKFHKNLPKDYFKTEFDEVKEESGIFSSSNKSSSSTLSLHIAAYENYVETQISDLLSNDDLEKKDKKITVSKNSRKQSVASSFFEQLEFPRQQKDELSKPEVQQFTASQKLFTPVQRPVGRPIIPEPAVVRTSGRMPLYDDIAPTVTRQRTPDRKISNSSNNDFETSSKSQQQSKDKAFAGVNMFAPRTLMTKTNKPPPRTSAPSTLRTIYANPSEPSSHSSAAPTSSQPAPPMVDFAELKNQVLQKKLELDRLKQGSTTTTTRPMQPLKAHRVDVTKIQAIPIIPQDIREDTEFLFDEVHILDEYVPEKPNSYFEFMKSINCNPQFGEEIDDFKLEQLIQDEIINGQMEKERSPSPEPEKEAVSGTDVAANIMAKMGYTFGSGLGKHGQGMSSALKIEKKGGQAGKIIHETDEVMREVGLNPETFQGPITNILLLRNIYKIDDIPDDYDNELRPELSRYGVIKKLIIHRDPDAEDEFDQVRIFVDYPNKAAAIRAYADLNNRYFNGQSIRATFYPTDRFTLGHYYDASY